MRGWFVYNSNLNGRNLFFPIGVAGHGRRKQGMPTSIAYLRETDYGVMRYAHRVGLMPDGSGNYAEYRPLLYTMGTQHGAIYWLDGKNTQNYAWDINYSTFDFNTFTKDAIDIWTEGSDACFIRLVED